MNLEPVHLQGHMLSAAPDEEVRLPRGSWPVSVQRRSYQGRYGDLPYDVYVYLPPGWLPPVIYVPDGWEPAARGGLRRLGYGYSYPGGVATMDDVWALQPHRAILKVWRTLDWHRPAFWAWRHHLIGVRSDVDPRAIIQLRDLRPNVWPFNKACRIAHRPLT